MQVVYFTSPAELRQWFEENHASVQELWLGFKKKHTGEAGVTYAEAVDEALCFGWIDGLRKTIDESRYTIRFTPRKPKGIWSRVNLGHFERLSNEGLVRPAGLKVFQERDPARTNHYSFENFPQFSSAAEDRFKENAAAWQFFHEQPPSYKRVATWWVISAKKEETRQRRLDTLIRDSEKGRSIDAVTYDRLRYQRKTSQSPEESPRQP